ncbi:ATP-binding protein [Thalassotalea sp. 1_MG-2023]|uniref:ATP-binding protein n=1 Tax=Thalassotalea sp. 1_MG-2023 TaxID=3062680 RepID=UPI0026E1311A|nr:ATP-binding protein [Thalassotalea sp. 1_MG-2023]MDO6428276.1 ATP-binding protein [Thalassotalea sp. 1_MG-2023]
MVQLNNWFNSLKSRLLVSAVFMVVVLLPIVGITIIKAYQGHMESGVNNELTAYSYSLLTVAEYEQGQLQMPEILAENRFNIVQSGLYAAISDKNTDQLLWQSQSLLATALPEQVPSPAVGNERFTTIIIDDKEHFIYSFSVLFSDLTGEHAVTLHLIKDQSSFLVLMAEFKQQLWLGLLILMAVLLLLQYVWLRWSLQPLSRLTAEISAIEQGKSKQLSSRYPLELQQVTEQLNNLLDTEKMQRTRYRNALSDLAHSLKTPLAVIQGDVNTNNTANVQEQIDVMNLMIEHQLKRAQSAGHAAWYLGVTVAPCLQKLINSLEKIYREKSLIIDSQCDEQLMFKGDEADLLEILGNLLDNACKAAKSIVSIEVLSLNNKLVINVEDDGKGIAKTDVAKILKRGKRADTYQQGHGIGLAIVRDLVDSYKGTLAITHSTTYGGACFTLSFNQ